MRRIYFLQLLFFLIPHISISICTEQEKNIVIVITSYNNCEWYVKNLQSVFTQEYRHYRVIYIDDCSEDNTGSLVKEYIESKNLAHKVTLIRNKQRCRGLANHYKAIHLCKDHEIIVQLDGDDWFSTPDALSTINRIYQNPDVWITYGNFIKWPKNTIGHCFMPSIAEIKQNNYRESIKGASARTFYAWLAKQVKLEDLLCPAYPFVGKFFPTNYDWALMFPMLEMANGKFALIKKPLYTYNIRNPINDFKVNRGIQKVCGTIIKAKQKYQPLPALAYLHNYNIQSNVTSFGILILTTNPQRLQQSLESFKLLEGPIERIGILYQTLDQNLIDYYKKFEKAYTRITCINAYTEDLCISLSKFIQSLRSHYILCTDTTLLIKKYIPTRNCIALLCATHAYAFYLNPFVEANPNISLQPPVQELEDDIYAWQFKFGTNQWCKPHNFAMTLYKKDILLQLLTTNKYQTLTEFYTAWCKNPIDPNKVGLFFKQPKVIYV